MPTSFNNNYTELSDVNSGNQFQNGDGINANEMNVALQNTAHFKALTNNTVVRSASIVNGNVIRLVLATKTNTGNVTTTNLDIDISNINGVEKQKTYNNYQTTITNNGNLFSINISVLNSEDNQNYTIVFGDDRFEFIESHEDDGQTFTTETNLLKYPCFVSMINGNENIMINSVATTVSSSYSALLNFLPKFRWISATGFLTGGKIVTGVYLRDNELIVKYIYITGYEGGVVVNESQYTYSSSYFNISTQIKVI